MKVQHIVGADISKKTIDLVHHQSRNHQQLQNTNAGFKTFIKWLKQQQINTSELMIVMEHTGLYSICFEEFLHARGIAFAKVNSLAIKRSAGLLRGKTDKLDAVRIAQYGFEKKEKLTPYVPPSTALKRLQILHSTRDRLVKQKASLIRAIKEYRHIGIAENDIIIKSQLQLMKNFEKQIFNLQSEMQSIIESEEPLKTNFKLLNSIIGVGPVLAIATIIKTNNFTRFTDARKFACYCGTAPFEHTSGTSIKGKTRVSHLADKNMKSLLHLSAQTAIRNDKELQSFYHRRIQLGKSKMSTLNIVRNKILYRMFAVIKRKTSFIENYLQPAA